LSISGDYANAAFFVESARSVISWAGPSCRIVTPRYSGSHFLPDRQFWQFKQGGIIAWSRNILTTLCTLLNLLSFILDRDQIIFAILQGVVSYPIAILVVVVAGSVNRNGLV